MERDVFEFLALGEEKRFVSSGLRCADTESVNRETLGAPERSKGNGDGQSSAKHRKPGA